MRSDTPLFLLPFAVEGGPTVEPRALGLAMAEVLALALCARSFPIDVETTRVEGADGAPAGTGVVGHCRLTDGLSLRLETVTLPGGARSGERTFDLSIPDLLETLDRIVDWLREHGVGRGRQGGVPPSSLPDMILAARMLALEWQARAAPVLPTQEILDDLSEIEQLALARIGDAYMDRMIREWIIVICQLMMLKREPSPEDPFASGLTVERDDPDGVEHLFELVNEGVERGTDRGAYAACRVALLHHLDRQADALAFVDEIKEHSTLDGWYWKARCLHAAGRCEEAIEAAHEGLAIAPEGRFRDIVRGTNAEPDPGESTWRGVLLLVTGAAQVGAGQHRSAIGTLREARRLGADAVSALSYTARAYRGWSDMESRSSRRARALVLLRRHVATLEQIFQRQPRMEEVTAALDVADLLGDLSIKRRWKIRQSSLIASAPSE